MIFTENRKARHDYTILETYECGIQLLGSEVKGIVAKHVNLTGSFARIINNEVFLFGMHVSNPTSTVFYQKHEETRERKLLLHKKEIKKIANKLKLEQSTTLIPLKVYYNENNKIKVELAFCKGKNNYDKRQAIKERDLKKLL
jgi:SsrA-binding protein